MSMFQSISCRLCINICNGHRSLCDEDGRRNEVYEITAKYFTPLLLNLECVDHFTVICMECWSHIFEFHTFQQSVLLAQRMFVVNKRTEAAVKSEVENQLVEEELSTVQPKSVMTEAPCCNEVSYGGNNTLGSEDLTNTATSTCAPGPVSCVNDDVDPQSEAIVDDQGKDSCGNDDDDPDLQSEGFVKSEVAFMDTLGSEDLTNTATSTCAPDPGSCTDDNVDPQSETIVNEQGKNFCGNDDDPDQQSEGFVKSKVEFMGALGSEDLTNTATSTCAPGPVSCVNDDVDPQSEAIVNDQDKDSCGNDDEPVQQSEGFVKSEVEFMDTLGSEDLTNTATSTCAADPVSCTDDNVDPQSEAIVDDQDKDSSGNDDDSDQQSEGFVKSEVEFMEYIHNVPRDREFLTKNTASTFSQDRGNVSCDEDSLGSNDSDEQWQELDDPVGVFTGGEFDNHEHETTNSASASLSVAKTGHLKGFGPLKNIATSDTDKNLTSLAIQRSKGHGHTCEQCGRVYKSLSSLRRHNKEDHVKPSESVTFKCTICDRVYSKRRGLYSHMRNHATTQLFSCTYCPNTYQFRSAFFYHFKKVHPKEWEGKKKEKKQDKLKPKEKKIYKCNTCDKVYQKSLSLREHQAMHEGKILYHCTYCTSTFNHRNTFQRHKKKVHAEERQKLNKDCPSKGQVGPKKKKLSKKCKPTEDDRHGPEIMCSQVINVTMPFVN